MKEDLRNKALSYGREALSREVEALTNAQKVIGEAFIDAVERIMTVVAMGGRVIVTGVGKSGIIGKKIAASMASLGIPTYFVHADEALHGDLGMVGKNDIVIGLSHSGRTQELLAMIKHVKSFGNPVIAIVRDEDNPLARMSDVTICTHVKREADHLDTAPTASCIVTLAVGDALAITISRIRGFGKKDFLRLHPGGNLGETLSEALRGGV